MSYPTYIAKKILRTNYIILINVFAVLASDRYILQIPPLPPVTHCFLGAFGGNSSMQELPPLREQLAGRGQEALAFYENDSVNRVNDVTYLDVNRQWPIKQIVRHMRSHLGGPVVV